MLFYPLNSGNSSASANGSGNGASTAGGSSSGVKIADNQLQTQQLQSSSDFPGVNNTQRCVLTRVCLVAISGIMSFWADQVQCMGGL